MTCQPKSDLTGSLIWLTGSPKAASSNGLVILPVPNQPRSPALSLFELSLLSSAASLSNGSPLSSRSLAALAASSLSSRMWRGGVWGAGPRAPLWETVLRPPGGVFGGLVLLGQEGSVVV